MKKSKWSNVRVMTILILALFLAVMLVEWSIAQNITKINWLDGYVSAIGHGYQKKTGGPMDINNAVTAARIVAQSELLEAIKGVKIDRQTAVSDVMEEKTETSVRVQGFLRNAMMHGKPRIKEEGLYIVAEVEMRVCLHDNSVECKALQPLTSVLPKMSGTKSQKDASCDLLPNLTSTREILPKITYDTSKPLDLIIINLGGKAFNSGSKDFAIGFEPKKGQSCSIYTPEKVDPVVRRDRGTAEVFLQISDARQKYGTNLLIISAKSISLENYILIEKNDAYLINLINDQAKQALFRNAKIGIAVH